jgi:hypothetical protein
MLFSLRENHAGSFASLYTYCENALAIGDGQRHCGGG